MKKSSKAFLPSKPFYFVLIDDSNGVFNVFGPASDDTKLTASVAEAQENGRSIRCQTVDKYNSKEDVIADAKRELGLEYSSTFTI